MPRLEDAPKDASWALISMDAKTVSGMGSCIVAGRHTGDGINRHFQLVLPSKSVNDVLEGVGAGTWGRGNPEVLARFYWPGQRKEVWNNGVMGTSSHLTGLEL